MYQAGKLILIGMIVFLLATALGGCAPPEPTVWEYQVIIPDIKGE
ncbi:hypothetical protein VPHK469_0106 [Vibrio phage K469]